MKNILYFLLPLLALAATCFAQPYTVIGNGNPAYTNWNKGSVRIDANMVLLNYSMSDTFHCLAVDGSGHLISILKGATPPTPSLNDVATVDNHVTDQPIILANASNASTIQISSDAINFSGTTNSKTIVNSDWANATNLYIPDYPNSEDSICLASQETWQKVLDRGNQATGFVLVGGSYITTYQAGVISNSDGIYTQQITMTGLTANRNNPMPDEDGAIALQPAVDTAAENALVRLNNYTPPAQTLDNTLAAGNTSSDSILLDNTLSPPNNRYSVLSSERVAVGSGTGTYFKADDGGVFLGSQIASNLFGTLLVSNVSGSTKTVNFANSSGTVALTSQLTLNSILNLGNTTSLTASFISGSHAHTVSPVLTQLFTTGVGTTTVRDTGIVVSNATTNTTAGINYDGFYFANNAGSYKQTFVPNAVAGLSGASTIQGPATSGVLLNGDRGVATLVSGTVTVSNPLTLAGSAVTVTYRTPAGTIGATLKATVSTGSGFTITSETAALATQVLDTSTVQYIIVY